MRRFPTATAAIAVGLLSLASVGAQPLLAQQSDFLLERWSISLGAFNSRIDTDIRVDGENRRGTEFDVERDLDLERDPTVALFGVSRLFGKRHQLVFRYNEVSRDRARTLTREVVFRDRVFEVSSDVVTTFDTQTYELAYTYWLMRKNASAFGLSAGVLVQDFETTIQVRQAALQPSEEADAVLPVPLIGINYRHLLTERSRFLLSATVLPEVHVGDVESGSFLSLFAAIEFRLARAIALGVSYSLGDLRVEYRKLGFGGNLDYITEGAQVYARFLF